MRQSRWAGAPAAAALALSASTVGPSDGLDPGTILPMGGPKEGGQEAIIQPSRVKMLMQPEETAEDTLNAAYASKTVTPSILESKTGVLDAEEQHSAFMPLCVLPPTLSVPSPFLNLTATVRSKELPPAFVVAALHALLRSHIHYAEDGLSGDVVHQLPGMARASGFATGWAGVGPDQRSGQMDLARVLGTGELNGVVRDALSTLLPMSMEGELMALAGGPSDNIRSLTATLRKQVEGRIVAQAMKMKAEQERIARQAREAKKKRVSPSETTGSYPDKADLLLVLTFPSSL